MIPNFNKMSNKILGSSLALPANGLGGSRATSLSVAHFALQNTKFGSEKGKVQKPARIPPQTPPAGGKKAEAGQFHSPRKIVCPAESKLVFRVFLKKCSNFVQKTPPKIDRSIDTMLRSILLLFVSRKPAIQGVCPIEVFKTLCIAGFFCVIGFVWLSRHKEQFEYLLRKNNRVL